MKENIIVRQFLNGTSGEYVTRGTITRNVQKKRLRVPVANSLCTSPRIEWQEFHLVTFQDIVWAVNWNGENWVLMLPAGIECFLLALDWLAWE